MAKKRKSRLQHHVERIVERDGIDDDWRSHLAAVQETMFQIQKLPALSLLSPESAAQAKKIYEKKQQELSALLRRVRSVQTLLEQRRLSEADASEE